MPGGYNRDLYSQPTGRGTPQPQQPSGPTPEALANIDTYSKYYGGGYSTGSRTESSPDAYHRSSLRWDQSNQERTAEQRANFFYGGYQGGANDAIQQARQNVAPYSALLGQQGNQFFGQSVEGAGTMNQGIGGLYGTAGALNQYAQQGPGPSVAQAALEANSQAAMRQQLAIAGSGRGQGGGAAAQRQAMAQQAQIQGQANAQAAMLQAQETQDWRQAQLAAMQGAGALYGQGAGIGQQYAQGMGGLANQAQQGAGTLQLGVEQQANAINMGALQGSMGYEQGLNQIYGIDKGVEIGNKQLEAQQNAANMALLGTGLTVGGALLGTMVAPGAGTVAGGAGGAAVAQGVATSDIRAKTDIRPAGDEVAETLRRLGVKPSFEETYHPRGVIPKRQMPPTIVLDRSGRSVVSDVASGQQGSGYSQAQAFAKHYGIGTPVEPAPRSVTSQAFETPLADLRAASSSAYEYKNPERHGEGTHVGPMAQELEQTPAGASTVVTQPDGTKAVDTDRLSLLNTSALGGVQRNQDDFASRMAEVDKQIAEIRSMLGQENKKKGKGGARKQPKVDYDFAANEEGGDVRQPSTGPTKPIGYFGKLGDTIEGKAQGTRQFVEDKELRRGFSGDVSPEEEDRIRSEFYSPPERYREYAL